MNAAERQRALATVLIAHGWIDHPQSNSAHAMAEAIYKLRDLPVDDHDVAANLLDIVLTHNHDPNDTNLAGTVVDLIEYFRSIV